MSTHLWTTRANTSVPVSSMSDSHLLASLAKCLRDNWRLAYVLIFLNELASRGYRDTYPEFFIQDSLMDMLHLTRSALDSHGALTPSINPHIQSVMAAITTNVPDRMKAIIAQSQLTTFASQFRRNLRLWDDSSIPVNSVSFVITGSGDGKDSSVKAARKCFTSGYDMIEQARKSTAIKHAQDAAREAGETLYTDFDIYKSYMRPIPPIDIRPTTGPGFIQHVNDLGEHSLGAGLLYSGKL